MVTSKAIWETSCHKKFLVFYCAHIYYLCRLSVIPFDKILIMAGTQTRRAQQQILDFFIRRNGKFSYVAKGFIQKIRSSRRVGGGSHWKENKSEQGEGCPRVCIGSLFKKICWVSKWSFIVILQFFLLTIIAGWNIKQTIMKGYNIQSYQWMALGRFRQPTKDHQCGLC